MARVHCLEERKLDFMISNHQLKKVPVKKTTWSTLATTPTME
jgi:hypothetical protein